MKRIACIGDSNTYGYDPCSPFGSRYPAAFRWPDLLAAQGFAAANLGQNGLGVTRESVHPVLARELRLTGPFALTAVMLGTNDLLTGRSVKETSASMEKLLSLLTKEENAGRLLLIAPVPLKEGVWVNDPALLSLSAELTASFCALAGKMNISCTDPAAWDIPLAYDGVHFTEEGHLRFAKELGAVLRTIV